MKLRLVKFFTSRENEIEKKEEEEGAGSPSRAPSPSQPATIAPLLLSPSPFIISFSLPPPSPTSPHPTAQLVGRHVSGEQYSPAIPLPAVPLLPFFFIKLLKQQSVERRTVAGAQLADPAVTGRAQLAAPCPFTKSGGCPPASVSRCDLSAAIGAIGKQRPKMRFPVLFPSLTNK